MRNISKLQELFTCWLPQSLPVLITEKFKIPVQHSLEPRHLNGVLYHVEGSKGLVIFAHGSGSFSQSFRNQYLSEQLNKDGLSTLLVDLLTEPEQDTDDKTERLLNELPGAVLNKFNINLLSNRLIAITKWTIENLETKDMTIGYFGASTGSAAAFIAAAHKSINQNIAVIVSRSGRPDLAIQSLPMVRMPTLLIVGKKDSKKIIQYNNIALKKIGTKKKKLIMIPNATHLFEEERTLEQVAKYASGWFRCYFQIWQHKN